LSKKLNEINLAKTQILMYANGAWIHWNIP